MYHNMRTTFIWYLLIIGTISVTARSRRGYKPKQKTTYYRSLDDFTTSTDNEPKVSTKTKLIVIKPRSNNGDNEGRFFKHILLLKNFMEPQTGHGGYTFPYIIINNPTNLTNINNNTLTNTPAAATATATAGTGTATGTAPGARVPYRILSNSQALPYAIPMSLPTEVYQQRQQAVPQVVYGPPINTGNANIRRRNRNKNKNQKTNNPFSTFANSFKRIQFF